jgi:hypothetical protein
VQPGGTSKVERWLLPLCSGSWYSDDTGLVS